MNRTLKKALFVTLTAFALGTAARVGSAADDMGGMKMDKGSGKMEKTEKVDKKTDAPAADAKAKKGTEKVEIAITDKGFEPSSIEVKKGQPVELVFTRKTDQTCIKDVVLDNGSSKIEKPLPLNKPVVIKTKFAKAGEDKYACKMGMFSGTVKVQ
jgi:plastocyanin domain-containing protein